MGNKISVLDEISLDELSTKEITEMRKYKTRSKNRLLLCCKSPSNSSNTSLDLTPELGLPIIKKSRKCLVVDQKENSCINRNFKKNRISPKKIPSRCWKTAEKGSFLSAYFKVFDDDVIQDFLWMDSCHKLSDKVSLTRYGRRQRRLKTRNISLGTW